MTRVGEWIVPSLPPSGDIELDQKRQLTQGFLLIVLIAPCIGIFRALEVGFERAIAPLLIICLFLVCRQIYLRGNHILANRVGIVGASVLSLTVALTYREWNSGMLLIYVLIALCAWVVEGWRWGIALSVVGLSVVGSVTVLELTGVWKVEQDPASAWLMFLRYALLFCTIIWMLRKWELNQESLQIQVDQNHQAAISRAAAAERITDCLSRIATDPIVTGPNLEAGLDRVQAIAAEFVDVDRISVWLINEREQTLTTNGVFLRQSHTRTEPLSAPLSSCQKYIAELQTSKIIVANDAFKCDSFTEFTEYFKEVGITALLDGPIFLGGKAVGVVCFEQTSGTREWSDSEKLYVSMIADQLSLVILLNKQRESESEVRKINDELELRVEERTKELAIKNRDLELFSYAISHDLRGPLRSIVGFSQILETDYADRLDEEATTYLHRIRVNALRMSEMLDGILTYSRIGSSESKLETVRLQKFVQDVVESIQSQNVDQTTKFELKIDDVSFDVEKDALHLCVRNLVSNAVKFSSDQDPPIVTISGRVESDHLILSVTDNGIGFKMEYAEQMFNLFQRLESSHHQGTGIGLALVAKGVDRLGGTITPQSTPGKGATFTLSIPVRNVMQIGSVRLR